MAAGMRWQFWTETQLRNSDQPDQNPVDSLGHC